MPSQTCLTLLMLSNLLGLSNHTEMPAWVNQKLAPDPIMLKVLAQMPLLLLVDDVERKDTLAKIVISKKAFAITVIKKVIPKLYVSKGKETLVKSISAPKTLQTINSTVSIPQLECKVKVENKYFTFEVDTGASDNFMSESYWLSLGRQNLQPGSESFLSASGHDLPVLGIYTANSVKLLGQRKSVDKGEQLQFIVTTIPHLNLLGRDSIATLGISVDSMMNKSLCNDIKETVHLVSNYGKHDMTLQSACEQMCQNFPDVFKPELDCLKDFELDIRFKIDSKPIFCKPRPVPFALQNELAQAYEAGIKKGVWKMTQFNDYGTPVVPVRKTKLPGQESAGIRVWGDYSVTFNSQLETHRQPLPLPEELIHKLGGGYGFTKIYLADTYCTIKYP